MDLYLGKLIAILIQVGGYLGLTIIVIYITNSILGYSINENEKIAREIRSNDYKHGKFIPNKIDTRYKIDSISSKFEKYEAVKTTTKDKPCSEWKDNWVRQNGRLRKC
jgi:hypothetical protein